MSKHTEGPWEVAPSGYRVMAATKQVNGMAHYGKYICDTANNKQTRTPENEANARLISCAPELLEVLKSARTILGEAGSAEHVKQLTDEELGKLWIAVTKQADAVIAKTEGVAA